MGKREASEAVAKLLAAYRQEVAQETVALYVEKLADIPRPVLEAAVDRIIERGRFFPAISEIRESAARAAGLLPLSGPEALALVRRANVTRPVYRRDGTLAYVEHEWDWGPVGDRLTLELVRETLERVGEPQDGEGKAHFGWDAGFRGTYETAAADATVLVLADLSQARLPGHEPPQIGPGVKS